MMLAILILAFGLFLLYAIQPAVPEKEIPAASLVEFPEYAARAHRQKPLSVKAVSYNIGYASGEKNNRPLFLSRTEVEQNLQEMAEALKKLDPDIVAMQEVDFRSARTYDIDQFRFLARALQMPYGAYAVTWNKKYIAWPYWPFSRQFGRMVSGQAVLSRFPLTRQEITLLPKPASNPFWYNWFYLERLLQHLQMRAGTETWDLFNVHLEAFDPQRRLTQLQTLQEKVLASALTEKWVLGDFNLASQWTEGSRDQEEDITGALQKFAAATGLRLAAGATSLLSMPSWKPVKAIDHIFYSPLFRIEQAGRIEGLLASDHLLVWALFTLEPAR